MPAGSGLKPRAIPRSGTSFSIHYGSLFLEVPDERSHILWGGVGLANFPPPSSGYVRLRVSEPVPEGRCSLLLGRYLSRQGKHRAQM